jgi:TRAP-type C4-dicarboxylate transport system permease small subunit
MPWSRLVSDIKMEDACDTSAECVSSVDTPKNIFDRIIINSFSFICFSCATILTLVICVATFFRYILEGNLYGYEEWVKIIAFWLYFIGAAVGAYNRTHVSADLVNAYLPDGTLKNFLIVVRNLITVCVALLFTWYGYDFFMFGFRGPLGTGIAIPMTSVWRIPMWIGYLSVFLGLLFMVYYFARDLVISLRDLFGGGKG